MLSMIRKSLKSVAHEIQDSDLLLFRRRGLISYAGRGIHSHAAKAIWWGDTPMCVEMRWSGGRAVTLASQVERYPGRIEVRRANSGDRWPEYRRMEAAEKMKQFCGLPYGWLGLLTAALIHLPYVRRFIKPEVEDDAADRRPPFCSHACAMADRIGGGVDPVPNLADRLTEPCDLARSSFYQYQWTLTP